MNNKNILLPLLMILFFNSAVTKPDNSQVFYDPTKPPSLDKENGIDGGAKNAQINMIFYSNKKKVVIINGARYSEGELFGELLIKKISNNSVTLEDRGEPVTLYIVKRF